MATFYIFHDQADYGGSSYYIGSWLGFVADLAIGGAFKSLGKVFGKELLEQGARNVPVSGVVDAAGFAEKRVSLLGRWLGSKRLSANQLKQYEAQLAEYGVTLKRGAAATARLEKEGARAGFDSLENAVYLRKNATFYDAFHELQHVKHRALIGTAAYDDLLRTGTYAKEVHVFNQIWKNRSLFNKQELQHAIDYIRWLRTQYRRGAIL